MGLFDDILKGLPENAVLRAKVQEAKEENASLKQENAALKDDLRQAKAEIVKLKDEIQRLTHEPVLHETEIKILTLLASTDRFHNKQNIIAELGLDSTRLAYFLQALAERDYTYDRFSPEPVEGEPVEYLLTQKGRGFLIKNNLI